MPISLCAFFEVATCHRKVGWRCPPHSETQAPRRIAAFRSRPLSYPAELPLAQLYLSSLRASSFVQWNCMPRATGRRLAVLLCIRANALMSLFFTCFCICCVIYCYSCVPCTTPSTQLPCWSCIFIDKLFECVVSVWYDSVQIYAEAHSGKPLTVFVNCESDFAQRATHQQHNAVRTLHHCKSSWGADFRLG